MNPHLTYQATIANIDELHRQAAEQRLTRQTARSRPQPRVRRLGLNVRLRQRVV
jgi:hypothetical protein